MKSICNLYFTLNGMHSLASFYFYFYCKRPQIILAEVEVV